MSKKSSEALLLIFTIAILIGSPSISSAKKVCGESGQTLYAGPGSCPSIALKGAKIHAQRPKFHKLCNVSRRTEFELSWTAIKAESGMVNGIKTCTTIWRICTQCPKKK